MIPDYSGKLLAERYLLRRRIGFGGMATVYEAVDRELNKPVAVKILNPHYASQADYLARFRQEAREAARIRHENLVDVTDQGSTGDGLAFFVMEFLRGETLQGYLHPGEGESRPVPWRQMLTIVAQVCDALQHAHEHGVVHRDIKPGNIFLMSRRSGEFRVKVLDLGIAKILQGHRDAAAPPTTRGSQGTPGTPEYMSPEQVRGTPLASPQTDLYSVGVMMYRMLTGTLPFYSELSPYDVMEQHCKQAPEPPRKRAPSLEIPETLEREVMRALAKRPEERQASAQELGDTLRALEAIEARRERMLREGDEARTQQYRASAEPGQRTWARVLFYLAACLSGLTLSTTLFMVLVLLPFVARPNHTPLPRTAVAGSLLVTPDPRTPLATPLADTPRSTATNTAVPPNTPAAPAPTPSALPGHTGTPTAPPPERPKVDPGTSPIAEPKVPPATPPVPPVRTLAKYISQQKWLLDKRCRDHKMFSEETFVVNLELAAAGGPPVEIHFLKPTKKLLVQCVTRTLQNLTFPALAQTSFKGFIFKF